MNTIMVTCRGDSEFRKQLRVLSLRKGKPIGDLIREAIDAHLGSELASSFFADDRLSKDEKHTKNGRKGKK